MILETERLYLREMNQADYEALCRILQDEETMYAYEGAFSDEEVQEWLGRQVLKADEVCSIIRDTNTASQNVAVRNGMTRTDQYIKHYKGVDMPHYRYVVHR